MSSKIWSIEDSKELEFLYLEKDIKDIKLLAEHFNKKDRSIISKLVQLQIYKKPEKKPKSSLMPVKVALLELENILSISLEGDNLNKKSNLNKIVKALKNKIVR